MGVFSAFLFSLFIRIVISEEFSIGDSSEDSLVPVTIFITTEQYRACKEDGDCTFTPQSVSLNEPGEVHDHLEDKSYFELCRKIHFKMEKLESDHPEVKLLKLKLIQMFDTFSSEFEFEKGELIAIKLLDLVKNLIEKLKVEFDDKSHKPEPVPIIEPITVEEVTAEPEPGHPIFVGSIRGIPGIHFPNYTEIPITSFTCSDKNLIPGFYADLETGCQVFHLCYEHRRESFLCPVGTIFNQPILACDYWYSANCSQAPIYYEEPNVPEPKTIPTVIATVTKEKVGKIAKHPKEDVVSEVAMKDFLKFLPVKAKVTDIPEFGKPIKTPKLKSSVTVKDTEAIADKIFDGILSLGSRVVSKTSDTLRKIPDPQDEIPMKLKPKSFPFEDKLAAKAFSALPFSKAKKVTSAAKLSAATKMASAAAFTAGKAKMSSFAAIPIMKSKVASAAVLPMMKTKAASLKVPIVAAKAASLKVPLVKVKAASMKVPIVKGKLFTLPLAKTKFAASNIAALKVKKTAKAVPYLKMAALKPKFVMAPLKVKSTAALPIMKAKLAKAAISPLTKKALALGYLKLLKAKKLAVMG